MPKSQPKPWLVGRWLIESMDQWDREYIDEEVRGYFQFDADQGGDFQFGYVRGDIDYRPGNRDGKPAAEFSWSGYDAGGGDECSGRGWLTLDGDRLQGMFYFHLGDESGIVLKRAPAKKPSKGR